MTPEAITDLFSSALYIAMMMVTVIITPSLIVGLIVSVFQAATSINEQTMSFLPRLLITLTTLMIAGPWLAGTVYDFTVRLIGDIPMMIG